MRMGKAIRIVIETAAPRCDDAALRRLRVFVDAPTPLLELSIEDCDERAVLEGLGTPSAATRRALATTLQRCCTAALSRIPPIDQRATRSQAKQALRAVAALERLAVTIAGPVHLTRSRAA
jgi:hypothetical protein